MKIALQQDINNEITHAHAHSLLHTIRIDQSDARTPHTRTLAHIYTHCFWRLVASTCCLSAPTHIIKDSRKKTKVQKPKHKNRKCKLTCCFRFSMSPSCSAMVLRFWTYYHWLWLIFDFRVIYKEGEGGGDSFHCNANIPHRAHGGSGFGAGFETRRGCMMMLGFA